MQSNRLKQPLPIEALWEYNVQEITLDGWEILEKPLTAAENFQRVVNAIDFDATDDNSNKVKTEASIQQVSKVSEKMWLDLRDNIRNSLTEVCALIDLLAVLKKTKCLSIFPIAPEEPVINYATFLAGKKMGLSTAADTLLKGAERLSCRYSEISDAHQASETKAKSLSYHESLMELRKNWRLKLMHNVVLGEVSLRSIGSRYKEGGNFEVFESDKFAFESNESKKSDEVTAVVFSSTMEALLKNGYCSGRLRVSLKDCSVSENVEWQSLLSFYPHEEIKTSSTKTPTNQLERLCLAQNIIACREILSILSYEASVSKTGSRFDGTVAFSTQDEIIATVFPGVQISVSLDKRSPSVNQHADFNVPILHGLSTQLRRLLHQQHTSSWSNICSFPQLPTNAVQVPKRLRAAGAHCLPLDAFLTSTMIGAQSNQALHSIPIVVSSVAGFARPAASAWITTQLSGALGSRPMNQGAQDRHAFFNEWGTNVNQSATVFSTASGANPSGIGMLDDVLASSTSLTAYEHAMNMANVGESAKETVLGSSESILGRLITITRHHYLRQKVLRCLIAFAKSTNVCVVIHWHVNNSAVESSSFITFHCEGYSNFRCRIGLTVGTAGLTIHLSDSTQTIRLGTDLAQLWSILQAQEIKSQMHALTQLTSQFLGWSQLGCVSSSASVDLQNPNDAPASVLLIGSPKANHVACIRGSIGAGIRLLIKKTSWDSLSRLMTDSKRLQAAIECVEDTVEDVDRSPNMDANTPANRRSTSVAKGRVTSGFREVDLTRVPGAHAVEKIEAILTCLS